MFIDSRAVRLRHRRSRLVVEQLEDRALATAGPFYSRGGEIWVDNLGGDAAYTNELHLVSPRYAYLGSNHGNAGARYTLVGMPAGSPLQFRELVKDTGGFYGSDSEYAVVTGGSAAHGDVTIGFEDQPNGDWDLNDLVFRVSGSISDQPAPQLFVPASATVTAGTGAAIDLGVLFDSSGVGPWRLTVDWGDGSSTTQTVSAIGLLGSLEHTFVEPGRYPVQLTIADRYGGAASDSLVLDALAEPALPESPIPALDSPPVSSAAPEAFDLSEAVSVFVLRRPTGRGRRKRMVLAITSALDEAMPGGQVILVLEGLPRRVRYRGAAGTVPPENGVEAPFAVFDAPDGTLHPGQGMMVVLEFDVPQGKSLRFTPRVFLLPPG